MRVTATLTALTLMVAACGTAGDTATTIVRDTTTTTTSETTSSTLGATTSEASETTTTTTTTPETTSSTLGTTTSEAGETTTTTAPSISGARFVLTGISLGDAGMVVITNVGDAAGNLAGYFLCQRPSYYGFPDVEVPAGQSVAISTGGSVFLPPPGAITIDEIAAIGPLNAGNGEVGLYKSASFGSSTDIVSYVEWGGSDHGRSSVAIEAGIWSGFVPTDADSVLLTANTVPATSATDWDAS